MRRTSRRGCWRTRVLRSDPGRRNSRSSSAMSGRAGATWCAVPGSRPSNHCRHRYEDTQQRKLAIYRRNQIMNGSTTLTEDRLSPLAADALCGFGLQKKDAVDAARILVLADLFGISTHGVSRIESYGERLELAGIK